jgi:predicted ATPase
MILSMCGTHGTGKTLLATTLAEKTGMTFIPSKASEIHKIYGVGAGDNIPFSLRIQIQNHILNAWSDDYKRAKEIENVVIFDRCPLDFAAYLMGDVSRIVSEQDNTLSHRYIKHCLEVSSTLSNVLMINPHRKKKTGLDVDRENKPDPMNEIYSFKIEIIIRGLLVAAGVPYFNIVSQDLDERVNLVSRYMENEFSEKCEKVARQKLEALGWDSAIKH